MVGHVVTLLTYPVGPYSFLCRVADLARRGFRRGHRIHWPIHGVQEIQAESVSLLFSALALLPAIHAVGE